MKKIKIKQENKILIVLFGILFICFIAIGVLFYKYFYAGTSSTKYGDRLDDIEKYKLSETLEKDISSIYEKEKSVNKVSIDVKGRIIYVNIDFKESLKVDNAKSLAIKALDKIGTDNLTYYEVQFLLTYSGDDENSNYPIFGSKNSNSLKVVW